MVVILVVASVESRPLNTASGKPRGAVIDRAMSTFFEGLSSLKTSGPSPRGGGHKFDQSAPVANVVERKLAGPSPGDGH